MPRTFEIVHTWVSIHNAHTLDMHAYSQYVKFTDSFPSQHRQQLQLRQQSQYTILGHSDFMFY